LATHGAYTPLHARHPHRVAGMPALPTGAGLPSGRLRTVYALVRHLASYRRTTDLQQHVLYCTPVCKSGIGTRWHISKRQPHLLLHPSRAPQARCMHQHRSGRAVECLHGYPRSSQWHIPASSGVHGSIRCLVAVAVNKRCLSMGQMTLPER
jgi:hypothetical protein